MKAGGKKRKSNQLTQLAGVQTKSFLRKVQSATMYDVGHHTGGTYEYYFKSYTLGSGVK